MTDNQTTPPTHCSKPMLRSETKKGNPWWCSECGEYIQRGIPATTPSLTPATFRGVPFPTAPALPLTYREKEQMLGECLDRFTLRLVSKSHGTMLAIHYDMTQDEMESVESELKAPVCRYIWARVSKDDFEAL